MIRPARESDLQQIRFLAQTSMTLLVGRQFRRARRMAQAKVDFRELQEQGLIHVYMIDAALGGFIVFHQDGMDLHVEQVAVTPRFRRRGIGRALLNYVDTIGIARNCLRVILYPDTVAFENVAFYRSRGYTEVDRRGEEGASYVYLERYLR